MADAYDEALAKILASEKASVDLGEREIRIGNSLGEKEVLFLPADYAESIAKINRIAAGAGERARTALGVQEAGGAEAAQKQITVGIEKTEKGVAELFSDIKKEVGAMEKRVGGGGEKAAEEPKAQQGAARPAAHLGLGRLLGGVGKEMGKATAAQKPKAADEQGEKGLAGLSIADQIAGLERISLDFYDKGGSAEELERMKGEVLELSRRVKGESLRGTSGFEIKMVELRNQRLQEAMSLLGLKNA